MRGMAMKKFLTSTNKRVVRIQAVVAGVVAIIGGALAIAEALSPDPEEND